MLFIDFNELSDIKTKIIEVDRIPGIDPINIITVDYEPILSAIAHSKYFSSCTLSQVERKVNLNIITYIHILFIYFYLIGAFIIYV